LLENKARMPNCAVDSCHPPLPQFTFQI